MPRNEERTEQVQALRGYARLCNVDSCNDWSGRELVTEMMERIRASTGNNQAKKDAEKAFRAYEATFSAEDPMSTPPLVKAAAGFRLRGKSFLFTYNWDFFNKALPDGSRAFKDAEKLWESWLVEKKRMKKELQVVKSSSTLEESLLSNLLGRVHLHWKVELPSQLIIRL